MREEFDVVKRTVSNEKACKCYLCKILKIMRCNTIAPICCKYQQHVRKSHRQPHCDIQSQACDGIHAWLKNKDMQGACAVFLYLLYLHPASQERLDLIPTLLVKRVPWFCGTILFVFCSPLVEAAELPLDLNVTNGRDHTVLYNSFST